MMAWTRRRPAAVPARSNGAPALTDPVTGLGNQPALTAALAEALAARRPSALFLVEIDGFRALALRSGDPHGHDLLQRVARRLDHLEDAACFAVEAAVFGVLPRAVNDPRGLAEHLADDVTAELGDITASVGFATLDPGLSAFQHLQRTARALEVARRRGGMSITDAATLDDHLPVNVTPAKAQALHDLLQEQQLRVHYQPIVSLEDGRTIGFEALARPQLSSGLEGPAEAFAVAEHLGLAAELDALCRQSIFGDGPGYHMPRGTRLHVNISPRSLGHRSLGSAALREALDAAGLSPQRVVFELTEEGPLEPSLADREMRRLADLGFVLALDDFGVGSSGLQRLRGGLYSVIKVGRAVVAGAPTSRHDEAVLEATAAFADHTGATVVAEGIETADQLAFVRMFRPVGRRSWRIHGAQGFHIGRPQPDPYTPPSPFTL